MYRCETDDLLLAKCKTFNVVNVGRGKYLPSTVNAILAEQIYITSELCVRTKDYLPAQ